MERRRDEGFVPASPRRFSVAVSFSNSVSLLSRSVIFSGFIMTNLSAYILAKDEAENVGPLMDSLKGIRDVVVLDNGSTDGTQELFRKRGARVLDGTAVGKHTVLEADVPAFRERFGFDPQFTGGEVFDDSGFRRNYAAAKCYNDWVVNPDCDERPEWDLKKVRSMMNGQPGLLHRYIHRHNPDGTPQIEFVQCKLYNRHKSHYTGRIHEVLISKDTSKPVLNVDFCPDFVLHHWQRDRQRRANHVDQLEYQALKDETPRNLHYLGREYIALGAWDKALAVYDLYFSIDRGDFPEQMSQAWISRAECYRVTGRTDEAVSAYHKAIALDHTRREPFYFLGQLYQQQNQPQKALLWFAAANAVPFNQIGFMNDLRLYTWGIHENLALCYLQLGMRDLAQAHWLEALKHLPDGPPGSSEAYEAARILANGRMIMKEAPQAHR